MLNSLLACYERSQHIQSVTATPQVRYHWLQSEFLFPHLLLTPYFVFVLNNWFLFILTQNFRVNLSFPSFSCGRLFKCLTWKGGLPPFLHQRRWLVSPDFDQILFKDRFVFLNLGRHRNNILFYSVIWTFFNGLQSFFLFDFLLML